MEYNDNLVQVDELDTITKLRENRLAIANDKKNRIDAQVQELRERIRLDEEKLRGINEEILKYEKLIKERSDESQVPTKPESRNFWPALALFIVALALFLIMFVILVK